uniref:Uncharacterized protein n=1 Tax=viral metagenome TaxID=1070528 RepID=A0A6M3J1D7_9ZZZZ
MANLSYAALNALRGGYRGSDPEAEALYGMGVSAGGNAISARNLAEQLKFQREALAQEGAISRETLGLREKESTGTLGLGERELTERAALERERLGIEEQKFGLEEQKFGATQDVANVGNLANLISQLRFASDMASIQPYGASNQWSNISQGIRGLIGKTISGRPTSIKPATLARKSLSM